MDPKFSYEQGVVYYLTDWHFGHKDCDINDALEAYNNKHLSFQELIDAADEVDSGWREGFTHSIYNTNPV